MTSAATDPWLEARLADVPPRLAHALRRLAAGVGDEALAAAALAGFERVAGRCSRREGALDLLAADALLTYAFEAAADTDAGGGAARAAALASRVGDRLRERLAGFEGERG